ncbi:MAG: RHS repeat-associated core domain-containing protein, partial [Desulfatitalea sp.]
NESFTLDAKANRLADSHGRYEIDAADRIALPGFDHDALGNQTEASGPTGQSTYGWASANRLASAATPGTEARYAYDAFGRRVEKRVNGIRTRYVWAGAQVLQEIVLGPDADRTIDYLFFPGTPVLLALRQNQRMYYAAFGHRYETLCLTDINGAVAWQADYDAFGNARIQKGEEIYQPLRLAGHYYDAESGLHYSAARYYDPRLGRYLSLDPLFLEGGGDNFYAYCDGDPINRIDPHGELFFVPILIGMAIGAAIGAGIEYYRQKQSGNGTDGWKIAKAALIGGAIGAIGGGVGAAIEGAVAASTLAGMAGVGFLSGAGSSVAEQCAMATITGQAVPPLTMVKEALTDGAIGAAIGLIGLGVGAIFARRAKKAATTLAKNAPIEQGDQLAQAARKKAAAASPETQAKSRKSTDKGDITTTAEPVNAVSGEVILTQSDFSLPGRIPLNWTRHYGSHVQYNGLLGQGWQCPADARLQLEEEMVVFYDGSPGGAVFERLPTDTPVMEAANGSVLSAIQGGYQVQLKSGLCYQFGQAFDHDRSLVTRISDRAGNHLRFVREEGLLTAIQDNGGRTIRIACEQGRIVQMALGRRPLVRYQYQEGNLTAAIDAAGHAKHYTYEEGRLTRHRDRNGLSFYYDYDAKGRCIHSWGDNGLYDYRFEYPGYERRTQVTNSLGHVWQYHYDADRLPIKVVDGSGGATLYEYDAVGRIISVTDPLERITRYAYDAAGNLLEITRADDSRMAFVYDDRHRPIRILEPNDKILQQHFDDHGRLIEKISPLGAVTRYDYDRAGDLAAVTDPQGRITRFEWDPNGLIESVIQPSGERSHYQRDPFGNITAVIDPMGAATRYSYDERSRPVAAVSPTGLRQSFEWDPEDNLLLHTDAAGRQTRFEYTGINELARRINADGTVVQYHYDSEEHLTGVTNERGQTHRFVFDPAGRVAAQTDYYGQSRRYQYDPAGQVIRSIDPLGRTIDYAYDRTGRMIEKLFASEERETFSWDPAGQLIAFESPDIRVERTFDADGRLILEKSGSFWVQYDHDAGGLRIGRATSHGNRIVYTHDENGRVASIRINDQAPITFSRDALGRISAERLSEQLSRTYGYDQEGRLSHQRTASSLTQIERSYQYDLSGNLIAKQDSRAGDWRYAHDPLGRIVESIDPLHQVRHYTYDPA